MFFYSEENQTVGPSDPYFSNVSLLLKMDSDFSDSSQYAHSSTVNGDVIISLTESKYGGASGYFDGNGDYVRFEHDSSLDLHDEASWTVEAWVRHTGNYSLYRPIVAKRNAPLNSNQWQFYLNVGSGDLRFFNGVEHSFSTTVPANQWVHLAFVRSSGNISAYMDGTFVKSVAANASAGTAPVCVGHVLGSSTEFWSGHIDDLRITKGVARYTANFTPPDSLPTN